MASYNSFIKKYKVNKNNEFHEKFFYNQIFNFIIISSLLFNFQLSLAGFV